MLSPWQWLIMAAVPPLIVMLYFLKLRRMPVQVPSTYLWQKTIEDLHVNSIWQRLRKNLLLLLQLLVVLALILACLRPGFRGEETLGERSIFMIDHSCSMQATDLNGRSRLAVAKEKAKELIDALDASDVGMVIAFSDGSDVKQGYTSDKRQLKLAVDAIVETNRTTDLNEALRAASGLANPGRTSQVEDLNDIQVAEAMPATMYIMSDGGFSPPQLDLGNLTAEYISIGGPNPNNVGIVAFTVERNIENEAQIEAFARVQNFGAEPVETTASLYLDGELVDTYPVSIDALASTGVSFEIQDVIEGRLKLELDYEDDFVADNVAFAGLDPPRQLEVVLVTPGNAALEAALATEPAQAVATIRIIDPAALNTPETQALAESGTIDLFIYEQCSPEKMPASNTLFIGELPPGDAWKGSELSGPLFIWDTNRSHPMMQYVDMRTINIVEGRTLEMPGGATELIRTDAGVLMGVGPREAYQDAVIGMALGIRTADGFMPNTDWTINRSFPVFLLNALEYLGGAVSTAGSKTIKPGEPVTLSLATRFESVQIIDPAGKKTTINRGGQTQLIYTQTDQLGFYEARPLESDRLLQLFTSNLFSEQESDIVPAAEVQIGAQSVTANTGQKDIVRIEYWRWLLALALVILTVEWYLYNRRVAV